MKYNFDEIIDRRGTYSSKWERYSGRFSGYKINEEKALSMWVADMDFRCMPEIIEALHERVEHGIFGYSSESVNDEFRKAACQWFKRRYRWICQPEWMLFSMGVVTAINNVIQEFTEAGEGVIIQPPVYYPFIHGPRNNGRKLILNRLKENNGHYEMDFENLETLAEDPHNKLLILCSPHNPAGRVWTEEELRKLLEICKKHGVIVFCDEIHGDLIMPDCRFTTCGIFEEYHDILILAHSPSKTFNLAGLTSALLTVPNDGFRERLAHRLYDINRIPTTQNLGPVAGTAAYRYGDDFADQVMEYVRGNVEYAREYLAKNLPQIKIGPHEGTYLIWFDFRDTGLSDEEIARKILEEAGVIGDLGSWFGEGGSGHMRFNYACPRAYVEEQMKRLSRTFGDIPAAANRQPIIQP